MRAALRDPYFLIQAVFVLVTVGTVAAALVHKTFRHPKFPMAALVLSRCVMPALLGAAWVTGIGMATATTWFGRVSNFLVLLALGAALFQAKARGGAALRPGRDLVLAGVVFSGAAFLSEVVVGEFSQGTWLSLVGMIAIGLSFAPPRWLITQLKRATAIWVIGSAITALIAPAYTWGDYGASLIGIDIRVHGLANHPNGLAPIMLLYLLLERAQPSAPWIRWSVGGTAFLLLVLAQSKTAWAAALVVVAIFWASRSRRSMAARLVVLGFVGATFVGAVVFTDAAEELDVVDRGQVESLRTLTGRTALWEYGIEAWRESPVFGGGPNLFMEFAERTNQAWAGQAHNQYVQTLGRHGLVGLVGLLLYVFVLLRYGFRHARATGHVSLALVSLLLLRSISESNLDGLGVEHFAIFTLLLSWERERAATIGAEDQTPAPVLAVATRRPPADPQEPASPHAFGR